MRRLAVPFALLGSVALLACGDGTATVRVTAIDSTASGAQALADADVLAYSAVQLNVVSIQVHVAGDRDQDSGDGSDEDGPDAGWVELLGEPIQVDLLQLAGGHLEDLVEGEIPAGKLGQFRLVLDEENPGQALKADGSTVAITAPSGTTSGLKFQNQLEAEAGTEVELPLDLDVSASLSETGTGELRIAPVIKRAAE